MDTDEKPLNFGEEPAQVPAIFRDQLPGILDPLSRSLMIAESDQELTGQALREAFLAWLTKSASSATQKAYARDVALFMRFAGIPPNQLERLSQIRPFTVAAWRDHLRDRGLAATSIGRKITVLRSLFTYLQVQGEMDTNPAHPHLVATPPVPRDGKTVGLSPEECRFMLDAPDPTTPVGIRDRAMLAVLAFTGCRVGELCRLRVGDIKMTSGHKIVEIRGKGGKERRVPLNREASTRLTAWIESSRLGERPEAALFPPARSARGHGADGFSQRHLSPRSVQLTIARYVRLLGLDPAVTVHSFRVTALTTARERGCDLVDIQTFAGHSDPKTTLSYIRNRDRLDKSPAYVLTYGNPDFATAI